MDILFWTMLGYLSGSVPFSLIIGRLAGGVDIRDYGDHNPGATNVLRSLGWRWAALALLLDYLKAALPVGLAWFFLGISSWSIVPVALAPLVGHSFPPWLKFRGGKAVAATFGIWTGLTVGAGPTVLGLLLGLMYAVIRPSGWAVLASILCFGGFVALYYAPAYPEFVWVWLGNLVVLVLRHWSELKQGPHLQGSLIDVIRRR